jgi:type III secretion system YscQ/HrcQ family protein
MSDAAPAEATPPAVANIGDLEVPVQFDLGSSTARIGALETMQAGFVFELDRSIADGVTIAVNGAAIGRGELVRVGDRFGVRVVEVHSDASVEP